MALFRVLDEGQIHWPLGRVFKGFYQRLQLTAVEGLLFLNKVVIEECSYYRINADTCNIIRGKGRPNVAKFILGINANRILWLVHFPLSYLSCP